VPLSVMNHAHGLKILWIKFKTLKASKVCNLRVNNYEKSESFQNGFAICKTFFWCISMHENFHTSLQTFWYQRQYVSMCIGNFVFYFNNFVFQRDYNVNYSFKTPVFFWKVFIFLEKYSLNFLRIFLIPIIYLMNFKNLLFLVPSANQIEIWINFRVIFEIMSISTPFSSCMFFKKRLQLPVNNAKNYLHSPRS
jgi:hypothetical protein